MLAGGGQELYSSVLIEQLISCPHAQFVFLGVGLAEADLIAKLGYLLDVVGTQHDAIVVNGAFIQRRVHVGISRTRDSREQHVQTVTVREGDASSSSWTHSGGGNPPPEWITLPASVSN